ncbi:dihydrofolate reductase [Cerasicoccus arenae]|uniref:Dihydrofolate reductase n=1 Tax=Cerasicoccus arenae TaxID=424488 RepID=A0A8J3DF58_9BACT|nr:dihydrofolate reductase [Cerasicoccus arenae]MBK1857174.1 dihydrofolate reductase [Cerasicoccus arenae]GHB92780.1 dihydrofolate reductase [Cerasicoccus arenae]
MTPPPFPNWIAIAAMAENRVIGNGNTIPWRLSEDFKFFKRTTMGHVLVMGRKTWDSIGRPLPGRETIVISRTAQPDDLPGATLIRSLDALEAFDPGDRQIFIAGGGEIYRQTLPRCAELLLTRVKLTPPGDAWMPVFEDLFEPTERLLDYPEFETIRLRRMEVKA